MAEIDDQLPPGVPEFTHRVTEPRLRKPPFGAIAVFLVLVVVTFVPLVVIARQRVMKKEEPRVHLVQDMDNQPRYEEQSPSSVFADGRAMRPPIPGTVARHKLNEDDHHHRGYSRRAGADDKAQVTFFEGFPQQVPLTRDLVEKGRERFNIHCAVCHGLDGKGDGTANRRGIELIDAGQSKWTQASNLTSPGTVARKDGEIYNAINNGIRNMGEYGSRTTADERWAIVAYVRALQMREIQSASATGAARE